MLTHLEAFRVLARALNDLHILLPKAPFSIETGGENESFCVVSFQHPERVYGSKSEVCCLIINHPEQSSGAVLRVNVDIPMSMTLVYALSYMCQQYGIEYQEWAAPVKATDNDQ